MAVLLPALHHGVYLGPFNLLTAGGVKVHQLFKAHNVYFSDQLSAIMPWTVLATSQVHHGFLPLWNSFGALGSPLAFNWQSAVFSFPALVGYLFPAHLSYTISIIVTIIVAGTGGYTFSRLVGIGVIGSAMAGTVFELGGPFIGWLGWPHAAVVSWAGWLFAAALLILRGGKRARNVAIFSIVLAFAIYAGQPEILTQLLMTLAVFLLVLLIHRVWSENLRSITAPIVDLALGSIAGVALAAPLVLPGVELGTASVHAAVITTPPLPTHDLPYLIISGFDGLPVPGSKMFGPWGSVYIGAYFGIIAIVLAVVAIVLRRRSPEVVALTVVGVLTGAISFATLIPYAPSVIKVIPVAGYAPSRFLLTMGFPIAVLAGAGVDALIRSNRVRVWRWTFVAFGGAGIVLLGVIALSVGDLPKLEERIRLRSFVWPVIEVMVGLLVTGSMILIARHSTNRHDPSPQAGGGFGRRTGSNARWAALALLTCQSAFLVTAGAPLFQSSSVFFPSSRATTKLQRSVGAALVGFGQPTILCNGLGIAPNINDMYAVHELAVYDPMLPKAMFSSVPSGSPRPSQVLKHSHGRFIGFPAQNIYCPAITTVSEARVYGVSYILEPSNTPGPSGTHFVTRIGKNDLYRVPNSYRATLVPLHGKGASITSPAKIVPVAVAMPKPSEWTMHVHSSSPQVLQLRLAYAPGWHATIDGQPLQLRPLAGIMMAATIPSGRHTIALRYWPESFTIGIVLAACTALGLTAAILVPRLRRRHRANSVPAEPRLVGRE